MFFGLAVQVEIFRNPHASTEAWHFGFFLLFCMNSYRLLNGSMGSKTEYEFKMRQTCYCFFLQKVTTQSRCVPSPALVSCSGRSAAREAASPRPHPAGLDTLRLHGQSASCEEWPEGTGRKPSHTSVAVYFLRIWHKLIKSDNFSAHQTFYILLV